MRAIAPILFVASAIFAQPPAIRTGAVFNSASRTPSMLPGGAIARGALFEIEGVRLGSSAQTTSVSVAGHSVPLIAVSPRHIQARMTANVPIGEVTLLVSVDGHLSAPYPLRVVNGNFAFFGRPASAAPGETITLSGTGLGPSPPEIWLGPQRAAVVSTHRGAGADPDEITIRIPAQSPIGCHVPVQARYPGAPAANTVTLTIGACEPPVVLSGRTAGLLAITRTVKPPATVTDDASAAFALRDAISPNPILAVPPPGTCATYTGAAAAETQPDARPGLDAGRELYIIRDRNQQPITAMPGAPGMYRRTLRGPGFLDPGTLTIGGDGGPDVGPFEIAIPAPVPLVWENRDSITSIDGRRGVTLWWRPPAKSKDALVLIGIRAIDTTQTAWAAAYCSASAASGTFTIPPEALATLPATNASLALSYVSSAVPVSAKGVDHAIALSIHIQSIELGRP